ncbi:MAG: hypothetical protein K0U39_00050, partial [Alphaproteobacteria bacterium]|nr:hypothetical protein [Alphaproteobacteria bacterium]
RALSKINHFFNNLSNQAEFKKLLTAVSSVSLTSEEIAELMMAQYKQNYSFSPRTSELLNKIDASRKLADLPDTAFSNLMTFILRHQLNFVAGNNAFNLAKHIKNLQVIEKTGNGDKDLTKALYATFKDKGNIRFLPKKSRELLQNMHKTAQKAGMDNYFKAIANIPLSQFVKAQLSYYQDLLIKIEQGAKPSADELKKLDLLHDELKRHNKLDAMPNRSQAYLENYQLEQDLKKNAPLNVNTLLKKLNDKKTLTVFQAFYLISQLKENQRKLLTDGKHPSSIEITKTLAHLPQDVRDKAAELEELKNSKLLGVIDKVIDQIRAEERRLSSRQFYVDELGAYLKLGSQFMEVRVKNKGLGTQKGDTPEKKLIDLFENKKQGKIISGQDIANILESFSFRYHKGIDYTADNRGTFNYVKDTKIQPTLAILYDSFIEDEKKQEYTVVVLEFNPEKGLLVSIFRHVKQVDSTIFANMPLKNGQRLGTYEFTSGNKKEHPHIEKLRVEAKDLQDYITKGVNEQIQLNLKAFKEKFALTFANKKQPTDEVFQLTFLSRKDDDYHSIALFTPGSKLYQQLLPKMKEKWLGRAAEWANKDTINTMDDFYGLIALPALRDQLKLETIIDILLKMKILLAEIGESNAKLNATIHKAQKTVIDLREFMNIEKKQLKIIIDD